MPPAVRLAAGRAGAGARGLVACSPSDKINSKAMHPMVQPEQEPTWLTTSAVIAIAGISVLLVVHRHKIRGLYFPTISISHAGAALVPAAQICVRLGEAAAVSSTD